MNDQELAHGPEGGEFNAQIRVMQIIAGALTAQVTVFALIAVALTMGKQPTGSTISYVAVGYAAVMIVLLAIIPSFFARQQVDQAASSGGSSDDGTTKLQLYRAYKVSMIIRMAMLEGAAFFSLVAYIVEVNVLPLATAGALLFLMLTSFPTRTRVEDWVETQLREMSL